MSSLGIITNDRLAIYRIPELVLRLPAPDDAQPEVAVHRVVAHLAAQVRNVHENLFPGPAADDVGDEQHIA